MMKWLFMIVFFFLGCSHLHPSEWCQRDFWRVIIDILPCFRTYTHAVCDSCWWESNTITQAHRIKKYDDNKQNTNNMKQEKDGVSACECAMEGCSICGIYCKHYHYSYYLNKYEIYYITMWDCLCCDPLLSYLLLHSKRMYVPYIFSANHLRQKLSLTPSSFVAGVVVQRFWFRSTALKIQPSFLSLSHH